MGRWTGLDSGSARRRMPLRHRNVIIGTSLVAVGAVLSTAVAMPALANMANSAHVHRMARIGALATSDCDALIGPTPAHRSFTKSLAIPPKIDRRNSGSAVRLYMKAGTHRFSDDMPATKTFGYALEDDATDVYLGPTIETRKGQPLKLSVTNDLGEHPMSSVLDTQVMGAELSDASAPRGTVHVHGAHSEPQYDGLPDSTFSPGQSYTYLYGNDQDATGLWYHDHSWGITRLQVTAGLAGQLWLRDQYDTGSADNPLHLPSGRYEVPLTIQDRTFNADGSFAYPIGPHCGLGGLPAGHPNQWSPESFGDVATVNGVIEPNLTVSRTVYRFRVLNGSNARFYNMRLARIDASGNPTLEQLPIHQIGSDGGLLNAPAPVAKLRMAPGERADVLVDFSKLPAGSRWRLVNDAPAPYPEGGDGDIAQVMQFTVGKAEAPRGVVPTTLRGGRNQPKLLPAVSSPASPAVEGQLHATTVRTVFLNEIINDDTVAGIQAEPVHVLMGNQFYADDLTMTPRTEQVEAPGVNTVEEWDIINTTGDAHPIHLHLTQFRLLNRQNLAMDPDSGETVYLVDKLSCGGAAADPANCAEGLPFPTSANQGPWPAPAVDDYLAGEPIAPIASESGWKDTIIAMPGTVTRIIVPFGGTAAGIPAPFVGDAKNAPVQRFSGTYVFHCHILEHEDNDMMSPLVVR